MLRAWRESPEDAVSFRTIIRANLAGWSRQLPRLRQAVHVEESPAGWRQIASGDSEGRTFITWFQDRAIRGFDSSTGQPVPLAPFLEDKIFYSVSPDGRWLGLGDKRGYSVFDRDTGKEAPGVSALLARIGPAYFSEVPDVAIIVDHRDHTSYFWDLRTNKEFPTSVRLAEVDDFRLTRTVDGRPLGLASATGPWTLKKWATNGANSITSLGWRSCVRVSWPCTRGSRAFTLGSPRGCRLAWSATANGSWRGPRRSRASTGRARTPGHASAPWTLPPGSPLTRSRGIATAWGCVATSDPCRRAGRHARDGNVAATYIRVG